MTSTASLFHLLRHARAVAAGVLTWWLLSLSAAVITPALAASPADADLHQVCSASGVQQSVDSGHSAPAEPSGSGGHCALCLGGAAPLGSAPAALPITRSANAFIRVAATPAPHSRHAGPAPARGPPPA